MSSKTCVASGLKLVSIVCLLGAVAACGARSHLSPPIAGPLSSAPEPLAVLRAPALKHGDLVIWEIVANGVGGAEEELQNERIVLKNTTTQPIDPAGLVLTDQQGAWPIPAREGRTIAPGATLAIASADIHRGVSLPSDTICTQTLCLTNSGEMVSLCNGSVCIDSVRYPASPIQGEVLPRSRFLPAAGNCQSCVTAGVSDAPDYSITLWGAAREVQGSCYVVRLGGFCVLVDCGSFMNTEGLPGGSGSHSDNDFSFDPREIDAVLITHAHDDHMGRLPHLVAAGFEGPIYTTGVSKEIIQVKLEDKIGFWECSPVSKDRARRLLLGEGALLRAVSYRERIALADGITATFLNAGHIPGSAAIALTFTLRGEDHTVVFSGDVGSGSHPFLSQPDYSALSAVNADLLVLEATYGGSQRPQTDSLLAEFYSSIREAVDKGNTVVIPSFSLDRTQRVLAAIVAGLQGPYPVLNLPRGVVVGGKLSCLLTRVYVRFQENEPTYNAYFSEAFWSTRPMADPLWTYVRRGEQCDCSDCESPESLDALRRGCNIIVTASGFGSDSDTLSYKLLSRFVTDPMVTFIKVGWAPPDSPMGRLAAAHDANSRIVLLEDGGVPRTQACGFSNVSASFSGHADQTGLITFAKKLGHLARIAVVHGDPDNVKALAAALVSQIPLESSAIYTPMRGQFISLLSP